MKLALWSLAVALLAAASWLTWPRGDTNAPPTTPSAAATPTEATATATATAAPAAAPERAAASATENTPAAQFAGSVVGDRGDAIVGAEVALFSSPMAANSSPLAMTPTDGDGRFGIVVDRAWTGPFTLSVRATGHAPAVRDHATPTTSIRVRLNAIATLHGRVLELGTGHALAGASVSTESASTTTDAAGHYELIAELGDAFLRET